MEAEFQKLLELLKQVLKEKNGDDLLKQIYIITMYKITANLFVDD